MDMLIYGLCALTALGCSWLLLRGYRRNKYPLLLWAGLCFLGLSANNTLLIVDKFVFPKNDLMSWRLLAALSGMLLLLYGLIWESE